MRAIITYIPFVILIMTNDLKRSAVYQITDFYFYYRFSVFRYSYNALLKTVIKVLTVAGISKSKSVAVECITSTNGKRR